MSDEELFGLACRDPEAFATLYRRHVGIVVAFAVRRCIRPDQVPDLVAAVWLEVIDSAERFDASRGSAPGWILGIAANLAASSARRAAREREALKRLAGRRVLDEADEARLERAIDAAAIAPMLRNALSALPSGERSVMELVALDGLAPKDAAAALGLAPAAARMRLARARRRLREWLGPDVAPHVIETAEEVR